MQKLPLKSYRDLIAWQRAMSLADAIHELVTSLPRRRSSLASQLERAAISIPANIAEGYGRASRRTYSHFLRIAQGSLKELETHLILAERVGVTPQRSTEALLDQADELGRMLRSLITRVQERPAD